MGTFWSTPVGGDDILQKGDKVQFFYGGKYYTGIVEAFFDYRKHYSIIPDNTKFFKNRKLSISFYNVKKIEDK